MKITIHNAGQVVSQKDIGEDRKTVYHDKAAFIAQLGPDVVQQVVALAETDNRALLWRLNLDHIDIIDLNNLPVWFMDGVAAIVEAGIVTQEKADEILEII